MTDKARLEAQQIIVEVIRDHFPEMGSVSSYSLAGKIVAALRETSTSEPTCANGCPEPTHKFSCEYAGQPVRH